MSARKLVYTALFAVLTAVGAFLRIPLGVSSITLQFLFTAMAGVLLGGIPFVHNNIEYIAVIIVAVSVVPVIIEYLRGRSKAKQESAE